MKNELAALLPRLEGGEASDDLDALILCAFAAPAGSYVEQSPINGAWCIYDGTTDRSGLPRLWDKRGWYRVGGWPLTQSLDAALALAERVLPGWAWMVRGSHYDGDEASRARVWQPYADPPAGDFDALSPTPALALCAAIVKAKIGEVG